MTIFSSSPSFHQVNHGSDHQGHLFIMPIKVQTIIMVRK
ncbi:MAG: hypothetical protein AVDCRST_MAG56-7533 [uncultured Cytophagales bacterium]|uniref:Uncharacterized protein n=1 Tax=uncultured Cytophagales bacterium TaxID=158755 RepID=A0A6J4LFH4_9SPHI|nr:MAG: hypothetical protein AVDCRST_MAG56-7533 [uncultured Cytophagales bacterium]